MFCGIILRRSLISISVLDFVLYKDIEKFHSVFYLREKDNDIWFSDKMEFHVIELPKIQEQLQTFLNSGKLAADDPALLWAAFFSAERKEEFEMLSTQNAQIQSAWERLQLISRDKKRREEYLLREKALRDYQEGLLESEEKGRAEGRAEGIRISARVIKLYCQGNSPEQIARNTGSPLEEVNRILKDAECIS